MNLNNSANNNMKLELLYYNIILYTRIISDFYNFTYLYVLSLYAVI